ncbi:MAG: hypothetical protein ACFB2W_10940 [Leptolyngbyaceae cyanobacterium]
MEPSPLNFVSQTHYYRGGDVVVDASAAIAPGVVFRAAPNGSIRVGPGACIGAGVVIQAKQGGIYIEAGASLGTGVLIVGQGYVGKDACVGPSSTLINPAIAPSTIIPSCSLVQANISPQPHSSAQNGAGSTFQTSNFSDNVEASDGPVPSVPIPPRTSPTVQPQSVSPKAVDVPDIGSEPPATPSTNASSISTPDHVYGRDHLNNLLSALFPHRQPLNNGDSSH